MVYRISITFGMEEPTSRSTDWVRCVPVEAKHAQVDKT